MRRTHRIAGAAAVSLGASLAGLAALGPPASGATSAKTQYQAVLRAAGSESVHYVSKANDQGVVLEVIGDTGQTSGSQVLVIQSGSTVEELEVVLVGATGYVRGNANSLQKIIGLSAAQSTTYTNVWLSFPATDPTLAQLVGGLRNKDVATELAMSGPYTLAGTKKVGGHTTQGVKGFATSSSGGKVSIALYYETGTTPHPVEEVTNPGKAGGIAGTVTFSKWGEKNHTVAPSKVVSLASLAPAG
ncbi:MAG TPA: hypothetical protein VG298_09645 [Acidimicrobiales bacterium]|jgi:hypothetical protein|nr:hypothetical protein [Acidimicrobiales bacterium]